VVALVVVVIAAEVVEVGVGVEGGFEWSASVVSERLYQFLFRGLSLVSEYRVTRRLIMNYSWSIICGNASS